MSDLETAVEKNRNVLQAELGLIVVIVGCILFMVISWQISLFIHPPTAEDARNEVARALAPYVEKDADRTKLVDELKVRGITSPEQLDKTTLNEIIILMEQHKAEEETKMVIDKLFQGGK